MLLAMPLSASADGVPTIYCGVYSMSSWGSDLQQGIYSFQPGSAIEFTKVSPQETSAHLVPLGGAAVYDGVLHGVYYTYMDGGYNFLYEEFDINTWQRISYKLVNQSNLAATCNVTLNPKDKKVYGQFYNFNLDYQVVNRKFATVDYSTQTKTIIGDPMTVKLVATFCTSYGDIYGIDDEGDLVYIDKTDGEATVMGSLGLSLNSAKPMSAITDYSTNKTYFAAQTTDGKAALYEISRYPAKATLVGEFPDNAVVVNMWIENMEVVPPTKPEDATPVAPTDVKLTYNEAQKKATLTWTAPETSVEKVALDPTTLRYNIVRQPDNVTVATKLNATTFSETIDGEGKDLKAYYYEVTPMNGNIAGNMAASNSVVLGEPLTPPYSEDFTIANNFNLFTVVDANNDGAQWQHYHYVGQYTGTSDYAMIESSRDNADDDYLLTPPIRLEKGGHYQLEFDVRKNFADYLYNQKMRVLVGQGDDMTDYEEVIAEFEIDDVNDIHMKDMVNIDEDGIYHIAFHATSNANTSKLILDNIVLGASLDVYAPDSVTVLKATAAADGSLKATVTFNAPLKNMHGDDLTEITKIVLRDNENKEYATLNSPTPGANCTMIAEGTKNGYNTFEVVPYLNGEQGMPNSVTIFVGQDYPTEPTSVILKDGGENAVLSWVAPQYGINGLPLNPAMLKYNLYDIDSEGYAVEKQQDITSPYTLDGPTKTGEQRLLYYAIDAENTAGWSNPVASNSIVAGVPYELPFNESFANGGVGDKFVWLEGNIDPNDFGLTKQYASDDDSGSLIFIPSYGAALNYVSFNTGKLTLSGATKPTLQFDYYCMPTTASSIGVLVDKFPQGDAQSVGVYALDGVDAEGWKTATIDLSSFSGEEYIIVKFLLTSNSMNEFVLIDNIRITPDVPSGIVSVDADGRNAADAPVFNISGQRVNTPQHGIFIQNGKKFVVK